MRTELLIDKDVSKSLQTGRILTLTEGLQPLSCPPMLPSEEVCHPKTINIKQYLNTKIKYQMCHFASCLNRVIQLNQKM
jgi:hypothetical protein